MRLGLVHINMGPMSRPGAVAQAARTAEAAGFDSVWAGEHLVLPDPQVPPSPMAPQDPALDSLLALTWAAAHTATIRLATGIVILPQRRPGRGRRAGPAARRARRARDQRDAAGAGRTPGGRIPCAAGACGPRRCCPPRCGGAGRPNGPPVRSGPCARTKGSVGWSGASPGGPGGGAGPPTPRRYTFVWWTRTRW